MEWLPLILATGLLIQPAAEPLRLAGYQVHRRPIPAAAGTPATDWSGSFVAWWDLEEASGTRIATGGTCASGTDCDLTDNNTVGQDTTNFVEGTAAALYVQANNEYLSCTAATCNELLFTSSFVAGCWARTVDDTAAERRFMGGGYNVTSGFLHQRLASTDANRCWVGDAGGAVNCVAATNSFPINTFGHQVCAFDDAANQIQPYVNGATSGSPCTQDSMVAGTASFLLSYNAATQDWDGQTDECFVRSGTLTAAQICRVCSCGIDGKYCMCDAATPANYRSCSTDADCQVAGNTTALCNGGTCVGRNNTETPNCGSCSLPSCNTAAP